ncbi:hypothetical protein ACWEO2_19895 [Nocardia sp. NPDC004278]
MRSREIEHAISQLRGDIDSLCELAHATDSAAKAANRTVRTADLQLRRLELRTGTQLADLLAARRSHGMAARHLGCRHANVNADVRQLQAG